MELQAKKEQLKKTIHIIKQQGTQPNISRLARQNDLSRPTVKKYFDSYEDWKATIE